MFTEYPAKIVEHLNSRIDYDNLKWPHASYGVKKVDSDVKDVRSTVTICDR